MTPWRFIPISAYDGATNMAADEAILDAHSRGLVPPTLRLYLFNPPAITLGRSQKLAPELVARINELGIDVVQRATGGRAVLHLDDLTYSFVCGDTSNGGPLSTSVTQSYKQICAGLLEALKILGVSCQLGAAGTPYRHLQDCFLATTGCDLHFEGTKLIGSAQMRRRGYVLQHGSLPLKQDPGLMSKLLPDETQGAGANSEAPSGPRHRNLFDIVGRQLSFAELNDAFRRGFEAAFSVEFQQCELSGLPLLASTGTQSLLRSLD